MKITKQRVISPLFVILATAAIAVGVEHKVDHYQPNWDSLANHNDSPEWFADAKLGIYFHWGVYSVPAYQNEWYPSNMYIEGSSVYKHHTKTYGHPSEFNYHDFVPMFTAKYFDAEEWAELFADTGAKFAGPVAVHHDGFAMWDSEVNPWNAADRGPRKDITGELSKSIKSRGMRLITTFHHARTMQRHFGDPEKWHNFASHFTYDPQFATSSTDPELAKLYGHLPEDHFHQYWFDELKEVIDQYAPDIIWFDTWLNYIPENYRQEFAAYYLNAAKKNDQEVVIAYKQNDMPRSVGVLDIEQGGKKDISDSVWLTDITLSEKSWCYVEGQTYKSAELVVRNMIDVWSKNGVVLLNISPKSNGEINREQRDCLKRIGNWMKKHAEAVYGTRPFEVKGFGAARANDGKYGGQSATVQYSASDGRFLTSKDGKNLYLFLLGKPDMGSEYVIKQLAKHNFFPEQGIKNITVVGSGTEVPWHMGFRAFHMTIPDEELDEIATVLRMELNESCLD